MLKVNSIWHFMLNDMDKFVCKLCGCDTPGLLMRGCQVSKSCSQEFVINLTYLDVVTEGPHVYNLVKEIRVSGHVMPFVFAYYLRFVLFHS